MSSNDDAVMRSPAGAVNIAVNIAAANIVGNHNDENLLNGNATRPASTADGTATTKHHAQPLAMQQDEIAVRDAPDKSLEHNLGRFTLYILHTNVFVYASLAAACTVAVVVCGAAVVALLVCFPFCPSIGDSSSSSVNATNVTNIATEAPNSTIADTLYPIASCAWATDVPVAQIPLSFATSLVLTVLFAYMFPGVGYLSLLTTTLTYGYLVYSVIVCATRDYFFWSAHPPFTSFVRCILNRELNEMLIFKWTLLALLHSKLMALMVHTESLYPGDFSRNKLRAVDWAHKVVTLYILPMLVARSFSQTAALSMFGWPYIYLGFIPCGHVVSQFLLERNTVLRFLAVLSVTCRIPELADHEVALQCAAEMQTRLQERERALSESLLPDSTSAPTAIVNNDEAVVNPLRNPRAIRAAIEIFDLDFLTLRFVLLLASYFTVYVCIISWDYFYHKNDVSYAESFWWFARERLSFAEYASRSWDVLDRVHLAAIIN